MIKVVDIFAGPGGLSEGFSTVKTESGETAFDVVLSIEKDAIAAETLRLRSFFRQFGPNVPDDYYRCLRGELHIDALYEAHKQQAKASEAHCWNITLGPGGEPTENVYQRIVKSLDKSSDWVLIGGPPCQAYSIAGRSRNQGNPDYVPANDARQLLYVEYLQILAEHRPAVFIMENVKGLLSATLNNIRMFDRILDDLRDPAIAVTREGRPCKHVRKGGYRIYSLCDGRLFENAELDGAVIRTEKFGVPQARHRIILLGIRDDIISVNPKKLKPHKAVSVSEVLDDLPKLRSGLTPKSADSDTAWEEGLRGQITSRWANAGAKKADSDELGELIRKHLGEIVVPEAGLGGDFIEAEVTSQYAKSWFCDHRINGVCKELPKSLISALQSFVITCAARRVRGQKDAHNSMLVHVTRFNLVQTQVMDLIYAELVHMTRMLEYNTGKQAVQFVGQLEELWNMNYLPTSANIKIDDPQMTPLTWKEVRAELLTAITRIEVRGINGDAGGVLDYDDPSNATGLNVVAVGGDKLSRGLTLEGLSVSYYIRPAKNYDTLLQMGRWFGYRPGYVDLCRLYTTGDLVGWYEHIAVANEELRREFNFMELSKLTPEDYGLKVRTHPDGLNITAANKIRHGRRMQVSFSGHLVQTTIFHKDAKIQEGNMKATESWLRSLPQPQSLPRRVEWKNVPAARIISFLESFTVHPLCRLAECDLLIKYIQKLLGFGELKNWTVALISSSESKATKETHAALMVVRGASITAARWGSAANTPCRKSNST
ncbi:Z1 domain-containing protein [Schlesneria paludicola]|uniref:Z1 domain-containing protein n=1 Tax=Schlesneria paludicola TaxID=360056 RepID=UPI00029A96FC|nr:Z1 domain-containing protein [Schlesneria paludicola]